MDLGNRSLRRTPNVSVGSKPEPLLDARISASAGCGHACRIRMVSLKPFPADLNLYDSQSLTDERVFVH